jgi:hypothetical protein
MHMSTEYSVKIRFFLSRTVRDLFSLRTGDRASIMLHEDGIGRRACALQNWIII